MQFSLRTLVSGSAPAPPVPRAGPAPRAVTGPSARCWGRGVWPAALLLAALLAPLVAMVAQAASLIELAQDVKAALAPAGAAFNLSAPPAQPGRAAPSFVRIGGLAFFAAQDAAHGRELWVSDGTLSGTRLVRDIHPGPGDSSPSDLTDFNGSLFFVANDGVHGAELWRSDGTPGGITLVADINPSAADANARPGPTVGAGVSHLTVVGDNLFFAANDGTHGNELWVYTGTAARLVKDINRGADGSGPDWLMNVDGNLLFAANDGTHGTQLWMSDGTPVNTTMVPVINPGVNAYPPWLAPIGTRPHLFAAEGLDGAAVWQTIGFPAAPARNLKLVDGSNRLWLTAAGNALFFSADHGTLGRKLWKNDGNPSGTPMATGLNPGAGGWPRLLFV